LTKKPNVPLNWKQQGCVDIPQIIDILNMSIREFNGVEFTNRDRNLIYDYLQRYFRVNHEADSIHVTDNGEIYINPDGDYGLMSEKGIVAEVTNIAIEMPI